MDKHRWSIEYFNPTGPRRLAPFLLWAETAELAEAYAREWAGAPQGDEFIDVHYWPSGALAA